MKNEQDYTVINKKNLEELVDELSWLNVTVLSKLNAFKQSNPFVQLESHILTLTQTIKTLDSQKKVEIDEILQNAGSIAARISVLAEEETHRLHQVAISEEVFLKESFQKKLEELFSQIDIYKESLTKARNRLDYEHKGFAKEFIKHINTQNKHNKIIFITFCTFGIIQTAMLLLIIFKVL